MDRLNLEIGHVNRNHYLHLLRPDRDDFYGSVGVILFDIFLKHNVFKVEFPKFTILNFFAYLSDPLSLIFLGMCFLCYWCWRFGFIDPQHMMRVEKKHAEQNLKSKGAAHNSVNFFGLLVAFVFFLISAKYKLFQS